MKDTIAMLLAGGQGSRLYALTQNIAKPAVPYGGKYRIKRVHIEYLRCLEHLFARHTGKCALDALPGDGGGLRKQLRRFVDGIADLAVKLGLSAVEGALV